MITPRILSLSAALLAGLLVIAMLAWTACSEHTWMREIDVASAQCQAGHYKDLMAQGGDPTVNFVQARIGCPHISTETDARRFQTYAEYTECREQGKAMYHQAFDDVGYELTNPAEMEQLDRRFTAGAVYHCWPVGGAEALPDLPGAPQ